MKKQHAIIIGAGYGGMALANLLGKAGWRVDVYEKNAAVGGRLYATKQDGFTFDMGPSWYLMPEVFDQYYSLFNQSAETRLKLMRLSPGYKVFFDNKPALIIQGNAKKDALTFEAIEPGAGKVLEQYVKRSTYIYNAAIMHFLYNNFDNLASMIKPSILPYAPRLLPMALTKLDTYVSRYFHDQRLKQILEYHMVFLGNSPFQAPAMYSLMSHLDFDTGVFYPKDGFMSLVADMQTLGSDYDIHYHTDANVRRIIVEDGKAGGIELADGNIAKADVVISNADLHFTETALLEPQHQTYPERYWKRRQAGPGALVISLGVRGKLPQLLHHTLYFVDDWKGNFGAIYDTKTIPEHASIYICNPNKTDASLAPKGHENLFVLVPLPSGIALTPKESEALSDKILRHIAEVIDQPDLVKRIVTKQMFGTADYGKQFNAWANNAFGGESHLLSQSAGWRTPNKSRKVRNLFYVGAGTQPGIGLPMCLISAELTFKRIMKVKKDGPLDAGDIDKRTTR